MPTRDNTRDKKMDVQNVQDVLSLTPMQEGMLFHYVQGETHHYHEQLSLQLTGPIRFELLEPAWNHVVEGNEMLRTVFQWEKLQKPVQIIRHIRRLALTTHDLSAFPDQERERMVREIIEEDRRTPIDLRTEPFRITVIKVSPQECVMVITNHHILYDGWSNGILLKEFFAAYQELACGRSMKKPAKTPFKTYIKWLQGRQQAAALDYWRQYLKGFDQVRPFPVLREHQAGQGGTEQLRYSFDQETTREINRFVTEHRTTHAALFYTVWGTVLRKYTLSDDVLFGTTVAGRNPGIPGVEEMVGLFINTIPIRVQAALDQPFSALLKEIDGHVKTSMQYEHTPLVEIKSVSQLDARDSLFDSIVVIENYPLERQLRDQQQQLQVKNYTMYETTTFDLALAVELNEQIAIQFGYTAEKFDRSSIERLANHCAVILSFILRHPHTPIGELPLVTGEEAGVILDQFNRTTAEYPADRTIHSLFEARAEKGPEQIAVTFDDTHLSYRELNTRANRLARTLAAKGVGPGSIVGLCADRSPEMIVGILAVLKAGGAYLPIHSSYPGERIRYLLEDSGARHLLTQQALQPKIRSAMGPGNPAGEDRYDGPQIIVLEEATAYTGTGENPGLELSSESLAYVIYTSGSTGKPKGVMVSHRALCNFLYSMYHAYDGQFGAEDTGLSLTNISFDVSVCEIFMPLVFGGRLALFANESVPDLHRLAAAITEQKITFAYIPPTLLKELYQLLRGQEIHLNKLLVGVEPIKDHVLEDYQNLSRDLRILNGYGPTEATICATFYRYGRTGAMGQNVPIGKPLANTQIYILDRNLSLLPVGVAGELCIAGDGLAEGYLRNPELTAEKFVKNPFRPGHRMYRTGDLARWLSDGDIEFLGRIDQQVKIRGYRIEPGEIESHLLRYPAVREALVLPKEDGTGVKYLCAYLVKDPAADGAAEFSPAELRAYLADRIPDYMIPSYFLTIESLPLTANGKIDRRALPEPAAALQGCRRYIAPRNGIEERLAAIWKDILGVVEAGIEDHFFEMGGHSLKATIMAGRINREFQVQIPLNIIFTAPTIRGIAEYIQTAIKTPYEAIEPAGGKELYAASSAQKRMYVLQQLEPASTVYNMPGVLEIEGELDLDRVESSFGELIRRHEILRTSFTLVEADVMQKIHPTAIFRVEYLTASDRGIEDLIGSFVRSFDLSSAPLFRVGIVPLAAERHLLLFDMHHIISDGISMTVFIREFATLYDGKELDELRLQYKDYAEWQHRFLQSDRLKEQEEYWLNVFDAEIPVLNLPTDYPRPTTLSHQGEQVCFSLSREVAEGLETIAAETGSTLYMVLLSGLNILFSKYTDQDDLIIGSPIAGRTHPAVEDLIGMFVNTLALRNRPEAAMSYREFLRNVRANTLDALEHQDYPFEELVEKVQPRKDLTRNPLFDVMLVLQNMPQGNLELHDLRIKPYPYEARTAKFDLTFTAAEVGDMIPFTVEYNAQLFRKETIQRMAAHLQQIFAGIAVNPECTLAALPMLTEEEKEEILYSFNNTAAEYPRQRTIHSFFEARAKEIPEQRAVVWDEGQLTYRELNAQANRLARSLRAKGVGADQIVGIMADRSPEMLIGILGILKSGGAYLPIIPEYPADRIRYMLADSRTHILLTQAKYRENVKIAGDVMELDRMPFTEVETEDPAPESGAQNLAYVIYTSGSTGKPKGVLVTHQSAVNILTQLEDEYPVAENGVYLLKTTFAFDVSVTELFGWFIGSGCLAILPPQEERDVQAIVRGIERHRVTHINFVPSMLGAFLAGMDEEASERLRSLRYLFVAGEAFPDTLLKRSRVKLPGVRVENLYGPTEATIYVTRYATEEWEEGRAVPIGKPLRNVQAYILSAANELMPIGVAGELCFGGDCLAQGYLHQPGLTAGKFVDNPFAPGERMYRTGDLARWLSDGNIEFLGRIDHQVKIRGYRIEPGEIESLLLQHESVREAVVIDRDDADGVKYLCAYLVGRESVEEGTEPGRNLAEIKTYLAGHLPAYMIPAYFVFLEALPLNANGKLDRKALPIPESTAVRQREYAPPRNTVEEKLVAVWQEVLGAADIGIDDHFFELGGHSLKAITMTGRIRKELQTEVPLHVIFAAPTIRGISDYIRTAVRTTYQTIERAAEKQLYAVSSSQRRMFILQQFQQESTVYNIPGVLAVDGKLDLGRVEEVLQQLIRRHETLRTSFVLAEEEIMQKIHAEAAFQVERIEGPYQSAEEGISCFMRAFDLGRAPLFRVGVWQMTEEESLLLFDMHHIISDGVSMGIFMNEFTALYAGNELDELPIQYKDYAEWQNQYLRSSQIKWQEDYWLGCFGDEVPVLNLPTDYPRPAVQSHSGEEIQFALDRDLTESLRELAAATGSTLYMVLLSGFTILLSRYSDQEDIVVGSPIAGRSHPDLEGLIGVFINTLALRNQPAAGKTYRAFLAEVRDRALRGFENQDYPLERLIEKLQLERESHRNPLFDVFFVLQNTGDGNLRLGDTGLRSYPFESKTAKFDLALLAKESDGTINMVFRYAAELFRHATIEQMTAHLKNIFTGLSRDPDCHLSEIEMLTAEEKAQLIYAVNETSADFPQDLTLQEIFAAQVNLHPERVAVTYEDQSLTYGELNTRANQLAGRLRAGGVKPDTVVSLLVDRSLAMMVGIFAVLKAGGAYLPISPTYPLDRILHILDDSRSEIVLTQCQYRDRIRFRGEVIDLDDETVYEGSGENPEILNTSSDPAYVIYTSGSTGKPKGVVIEHRSVINTISHLQRNYPLDQTDTLLQSTVYTFDASVREIFWWFFNGARCCLLAHDGEKDPRKIVETIDREQVTIAKFVPVLLAEVLNAVEEMGADTVQSLKYLLVGGEALTRQVVEKYFALFAVGPIQGPDGSKRIRPRLINLYGPSETTIHCTEYEVASPVEGIYAPIGRPISNDRVYILDPAGHPVPVGVPGELYIGGVGLAREYLNRPELTGERFVADPFVPGARMYQTGDRVRWLTDGNIEFLGRIDHQVKIRGYRIELGEIESQILDNPSIEEAVVIAREDEHGMPYLCAYFVPAQAVTVQEIREELQRQLPDYMIPAHFVQLEEMPLNTSGKVNRKELPAPGEVPAEGTSYIAPRNELEVQLAAIWSSVLHLERVGIEDNFFELGGHSLKATLVAGRIRKQFNVKMPLGEIFKTPTIKGLAEYIRSLTSMEESVPATTFEILRAPEREYYKASPAQKRMYVLQQFNLTSTQYNMSAVLEIQGDFDRARAEGAFRQLIQRHEALRTSFAIVQETVVQRIHSGVNFRIESVKMEKATVEEHVGHFISPFDLSRAPLFRVQIIEGEAGQRFLVFDMHHIISDGISMGIMIREFAALYAGNRLNELRIQYKDYAEWQRQWVQTERMKETEQYWLERFRGEIPVLNLPTDYPRSSVPAVEGECVQFRLHAEITRGLNRIAQRTGSTMYMVLLSGLNILLARYSGQEEIIIGSPIAGRSHPDLTHLIGVFVNTLAMKNNPAQEKKYSELIAEVRDHALQAYEHQDYQFEELVEKLHLNRDLAHNPLFDVIFVLQNTEQVCLDLQDVTIHLYPYQNQTTKFDLSFVATESGEEIAVRIEYSTHLFQRATVERMSLHLQRIFEAIVRDEEICLWEIDMLTPEERKTILYQFNDTAADYPVDQSIHRLFAAAAVQFADHVAVAFAEDELTYHELHVQSSQLAGTLQRYGVTLGSVVALIADRSLEMMVGILGILKAGGVYLPINPNYPEERIRYILEDSQAAVVLTQEHLRLSILFSGPILTLPDHRTTPGPVSADSLEVMVQPEALAYIIYTSGSTGKPKGVGISHKALCNFIFSFYRALNGEMGVGDSCLSVANIAFDASICELFAPILFGAKLVLFNQDQVLDIDGLAKVLIEQGITFAYIPPTILTEVYQRIRHAKVKLNKMLVGVEPIKDVVLEDYLRLQPNMQILNGYGPTEATICATFLKYQQGTPTGRNVPIGRPLANVQIYILDRYQQPVPIGVSGELYIAGDGLAEGYVHAPELTAEKFVKNPLTGKRMYKTGDLARWNSDGVIEFMGRIDHQVKIRGFRIEPGEIESQLLQHEAVQEAVVIPREDANGVKYLCAYFVSNQQIGPQEITILELRSYLTRSLPAYMIPSYFIPIEQFPLTVNGKIDRKALPEPDGSIVTGREYVAPQNESEVKLAAIWSGLLGIEKIGMEDSFFELGGHSLKATVLVQRIHQEMQVRIPLTEIFKRPTIRGLCEYIDQTSRTGFAVIEQEPEKEFYPASAAQRRMYVLQQFDPQSTGYNMPGVLEIEGRLDPAKVEAAFAALIRRHEILRTSFAAEGEEIIQKVHKTIDFAVSVQEQGDREISSLVKEFCRPFNLHQVPLFRVGIIRTGEERFLLMFDMHHMISDGVSQGILVKEFMTLYEGGRLEELRIQYRDYAEWQRLHRQSAAMQAQEAHWLEQFGDEIPILNLPTDYARPTLQSFAGDRLSLRLDSAVTGRLMKLAAQTGSTLYMVLLSAISILLARYSGQEDIVIGSPIAGRSHADVQNLIGVFVNTLAMRNRPAGTKVYSEFLQEVKKNALAAFEHQDYQFEEMVERLRLKKDLSRNPVFDVFFALQNYDEIEFRLTEITVKLYRYESQTAKFDLSFYASEKQDGIVLTAEYCTRLFAKETIERMTSHLQRILSQITSQPEICLHEIAILTDEEKATLLHDWNHTAAAYPADKTIPALFEEQVLRTPDRVAAIFEDQCLTYRELAEKADRLAGTLRSKGVGADQIVGIMVQRSLEMLIGIFGILKAGGAYLPIDPAYPVDRIQFMLEDSKAPLLLTMHGWESLVAFDGETVCLDDADSYSNDDLQPLCGRPTDLAYIIYTSGSTGKPKGVMIEHHSVLNRLQWMQRQYPIAEQDTILQKTPFTFDVSVWEIFWWSFQGARVLFLTPGGEKDPETLVQAIERHRVTTVHFVPSMLHIFLEYCMSKGAAERLQSLRRVFASGEALQPQQAERFNQYLNAANGTTLHNLYGPTEATVDVTYFDCLPERDLRVIPIGKPIDNTRMYILDQWGGLQPIGIPGELCIAGVNLARGYLMRPELTAERFVRLPSGERVYRTGDLARWMADGNIEYLGRLDHQVKIRGFRIELGEIESQLLRYPQIAEAVVIDRAGQDGVRYLCAYVVREQADRKDAEAEAGERRSGRLETGHFDGGSCVAGELNTDEIRAYLAQNLPEYMIPAFIIELEMMPLSANGKIDRKALPAPEGRIRTGVEYAAPETLIEGRLAEVWKEVLGIEPVGIDHNFFELGGHSLRATTLMTKIHQLFGVEMPLKEIFVRPTIRQMAKYIEHAGVGGYQQIEPLPEQACYPVSSAQKRLLILSELEEANTSYNMPYMLLVEGELDRERLHTALKGLMARHESLRTAFDLVDGEYVQRIERDVPLETAQYEGREEELEELIGAFIRPFDYRQAPLFRVGLVQLDGAKHLLMLDLAHIIADGASLPVLIRDFTELYQGHALLPLRIQYKDYAAWQKGQMQSERMEQFWLSTLSGEIPVLNLPTDQPRPSVMEYAGAAHQVRLGTELTAQLYSLERRTGTTRYMILLGALSTLLARYTGQDDIIIGTPVAGRAHADLAPLIGMFVNTLALRNYPVGTKRCEEFLREVRERTLEAYEHQNYPFEMLVDRLDLQRDLSRNALFDVMLVLQNNENGKLEIPGLTFSGLTFTDTTAKFDLLIGASEREGEIHLSLNYRTRLFREETIVRMADHLTNLLRAFAETPEATLAGLEMISAAERKQLIYDWNQTGADYRTDRLLHRLFEESVRRTPRKVAVSGPDRSLTYEEFNTEANRLARSLREHGVGRNTIVGILCDRSVEMLIGIYAVLKAGGAYLPIDPAYPAERVRYMAHECRAGIILTQHGLEEKPEFAGAYLYLDGISSAGREGEAYSIEENLSDCTEPGDLAYIIYTSGSTGQPKGVMIEHRSAVNIITDLSRRYPVGGEDVYLFKTAHTFDVSVSEIFGWFMGNGRLEILESGMEKDPLEILRTIERKGITHVNFVPSLFSLFMTVLEEEAVRSFASLKYIFVAGEAFPASLAELFYAKVRGITLENLYGPTEAAIYATGYSLEGFTGGSVPIGRPLSNVRAYVIDPRHRVLQPIGVPGELCIGGVGLARGYLCQPELTEEKFTVNPVCPDERIYRTGDLVRWLPDGNIEYLGRLDHQVKIRGFRIELGEIETHLFRHPAVQEAVVIARKDEEGAMELVAYYVAAEEFSMAGLRDYLAERLPEYMVPAHLVALEAMPLNANGKIDRRMLPDPLTVIRSGAEYEAPTSAIEERLAGIWHEILGVEQVSRNAQFFELGGHSLKATQLNIRIAKEFGVELTLKEIYRHPVLRDLAARIEEAAADRLFDGEFPRDEAYREIAAVRRNEYYELSFAQKRLWFVNQLDPASLAYNMPDRITLRERVDVKDIQRVLTILIDRHESFRTRFTVVAGEAVQVIEDRIPFELHVMDFSSCSEEEGNRRREAVYADVYQKPFDLTVAPLFRAVLLKLGEEHYELILNQHHIITDGWSMEIIKREFAQLYYGLREGRSMELPPLPVQYKDFAAWQNRQFAGSVAMQAAKEFWAGELQNLVPLQLPLDYLLAGDERRSAGYRMVIADEAHHGLHDLAQRTETSLFTVMLTAFELFLAQLTGQNAILVGVPIAGRDHEALRHVVGFFVNTTVAAIRIDPDEPFDSLLERVKEKMFRILTYQSYPLEFIVDELRIKYPPISAFFNMLNMGESAKERLEDTGSRHMVQVSEVKFEMACYLRDFANGVEVNCHYLTGCFKAETIEALMNRYRQILEEIAQDSTKLVGQYGQIKKRRKMF